MKLTKEFIFIILLIGVSLFLRTYNLSSVMQFIPDQGWFYLSARDMIITGEIPLVGPPTSHPWIHHGAHWTYALGILLLLFNFDPVAPAYFMGFLGAITTLCFYYVVRSIYSKKIAIFSSILFATSPLLVINSRLPYHTSPIPLFVILLFYCVYEWTKGRVWLFPAIMFLLGVLYNHEITTFVYVICVAIVFGFGILLKKKFALKLFNKKLIAVSITSFLIPMLPFIIYDMQNGWRQTFGFLIWVLYRIIKIPLSFIHPSFVSSGSNPSTFTEFFTYYVTLLLAVSSQISLIILFVSFIYVFIQIKKQVFFKKEIDCIRTGFYINTLSAKSMLLGLFLTVGFLGLLTHRVPIEADTLLISPFIILVTTLSLTWLFKEKFKLILLVFLIISISNVYYLLYTQYFTQNTSSNRITHETRMQAVAEVLNIAEGKSYRIVGRGELSDFPVFLMPYEYLLWWKGKPVDEINFSKTIEIWENGNTITISEIK